MNVNVQIMDKINMVTDENNIPSSKSNNKSHCSCKKKMSHLTLNNNSIIRQQQSNSEKPTKKELYNEYLQHTRPNSHKIVQTYDYRNEEIMENIKEGNNVVSDEEDAIQKFSYEIQQHSKRDSNDIATFNRMKRTFSPEFDYSEQNNNIEYDYDYNEKNYLSSYEKDYQKKILLKYQKEISKLKYKMQSLENESEKIKQHLDEQIRKKETIILKQQEQEENEQKIINEIISILEISSPNEIIPRVQLMLDQINKPESNLSYELINKIKDLYIRLSETTEKKEEIDVQIIWRWVKHLITTLNSLNQEQQKNIQILNELKRNDKYKNYFEQIIKEYNLKNVDELKSFISELLNINTMNKKRVHKLKKVLLDNDGYY